MDGTYGPASSFTFRLRAFQNPCKFRLCKSVKMRCRELRFGAFHNQVFPERAPTRDVADQVNGLGSFETVIHNADIGIGSPAQPVKIVELAKVGQVKSISQMHGGHIRRIRTMSIVKNGEEPNFS